jgi:UDP-glucose 4-epimerase
MRYLITGGTGYIGTRLVHRLGARPDVDRMVIADVRPPRRHMPKTEYERLDVRDRVGTRSLLRRVRPDAVVHLAFILNPIHDQGLMYDVDVGGCQNVLEAASGAGVQQVLVTSSTTAYGAFPDNPVPLTEEHPVRGMSRYAYARDKAESDRLCQLWALQHPERTMTIVRPSIVFGPGVDNYIVRLWTEQPFQADMGNLDAPIQFLHEDDLAEALVRLLEGRHAGAFNVAGEGLMTLRECAELAGSPTRRVPFRLYRALAGALWTLRVSEVPAGQLDFARFPWVVSNRKLKETLGWTPSHTSRETFEITMRAHGRLPAAHTETGRVEAPTHAASTGSGAL